MADEANNDHPGKKRPDQAIYRPGMFKKGIDLTQTQPRPENHPPPSERRLQQQLRRQQERERDESGYHPQQQHQQQQTGRGGQYQHQLPQQQQNPFYQNNQRNNSQYRSLPPTSRDRPYRGGGGGGGDNVSQSNGYQGGRTFNRGGTRGGGNAVGGGGGGYRPRDNNFDTRSVRSGRKQQQQNNFRPNNKNKFPSDTQSEMGGGNKNDDDDTHSIASTTFSTDTTACNNGFASELNSRNPSIQSLLSQDIQSFDWADLMADEEDRAISQLAKLPETDSNGNQEDDISSERTGPSTPRKLSSAVVAVDQQQHQTTIDRSSRPLLSSITTTNSNAEEKISLDVGENEINDLTKKIEQLETKENEGENEENQINKPSTSTETTTTEDPTTPTAMEKQPFAELNNQEQQENDTKFSNNENTFIIKPTPIDDIDSTSLKQSIQKACSSLTELEKKLQSLFRKSSLPEINEADMISFIKESSDNFNNSINKIIQFKFNSSCSSEDFKKCALDAMKVRIFVERAIPLLAVRKHKYVLTIVTDITLQALYVVSALMVYDLEQARKYQLIESFEAIWQKLISRVKIQITILGKNIVIPLITMIRSNIATIMEHLEIEKQIGEFSKAVINTDFNDFTQAILVSSQTSISEASPALLTFAGNAYRWHGDLARYQSMILGSSDYNPSLKFYFLSVILDPHNGTALNQMGAVASYKSSRRRHLARRRFGRRLSAIDERQEPSELLNAVFLFCHALTTAKPFNGCESKLLSLLNSPFENGHDADPNIERLTFVQHFLALSKKAFTGEEDDLQLYVDKVMGILIETFEVKNESNVFTGADFVYQTGILWSLIRMDRVKAEQKDYLKQMLVKYIELLGGSLLNIQMENETDEKALHSKIAFITTPLALLTQFWSHIGGGKLPGISALPDFDKIYPPKETQSHVILPEFLLFLHGDPEFNEFNFLTPSSTSTDSNNAATVIRLNIIKEFFQKYSS